MSPAWSQLLASAQIGRKYGWAVLAPASALVLAVIQNAVASRVLGPAGFGPFAVSVAILTLVGVAIGFGMPVSLVRFSTRLRPGDVDARASYHAVAWGVVFLGAALVGTVLTGLELTAGDRLRVWTPAHAAPAIIVGGFGIALTEMAAAEAQVLLDFRRYFFTVAAAALLRLVGIGCGLWLGGPSLLAALYGYAFGSLSASLLLAGPNIVGSARRLAKREWELAPLFQELAHFALPIVGSTFIVAAIGYVDTLLIAPVLGASDVGVYAAGVRLTTIQSTMLAGITTLALPLAGRAVSERWMGSFAKRVFLLGGALGVCVTISLVLLSTLLVRGVYGPLYSASAPLFAVLSIGLLINFVGNPLSQLAYAVGAPRILFVGHVCQLVALAVGLPLVASSYHLMGVAVFRSVVNIAVVSAIIVATVARIALGNQPAVEGA